MLKIKDIKAEKVIAVLVSISMIYLIVITNTIFVTYNKSLYLKEFEKQQTSERINNPGQKLYNILNFFQHKEDLNSNDYDSAQISHMLDVRNFYDLLVIIFWIIFILDIIALWFLFNYFRMNLSYLVKTIRNGAIITIVAIILILILAMTLFPIFFTSFHEIFFKPGTWTFSYDTTLIKLFPFEFWQDMCMNVGLFSLMTSAIILVFSMALIFLDKRFDILSNKH